MHNVYLVRGNYPVRVHAVVSLYYLFFSSCLSLSLIPGRS